MIRFYLTFFLIVTLHAVPAFAQKPKSNLKLSGSFGIYDDAYHIKSDSANAIAPRRPNNVGRVVVNTVITKKYFSLPITLSYSTFQSSEIAPLLSGAKNLNTKNLKEIVTNPLNRFGLAPKYKWVQLLLGSQIPNYSELSVGDLSMFGAGLNLTPGKFRFSCFTGKSQNAIAEDTTKGIKGVYARRIYVAKIGVGQEDLSHIYLIASMMKDDTNSLSLIPHSLAPQSGLMSSLDFRINFTKKFYLSGEVAASAYNRNDFSSETKINSVSIPSQLFVTRLSTKLDYASTLSIGFKGKQFGIKTTGKYIGEGFSPLGYPFMQTDRLDLTISPTLILAKGKIFFGGIVGQRINNLSGIRSSTSTQTLLSANLNCQFTEKLYLGGSYTNFGFRNSITNDTFKLEMVTQSWSISPGYNFNTKKSAHQFMLMFSQNTFVDYNTINGALSNNDALNYVLSYNFLSLNKPFSFNTMLSYLDNNSSFGKILTKSATVQFGYQFLKKKLSTTLGFTVSENTFNNDASGFQIMNNSGIKYQLKKKINFGLNGAFNLFKYGIARPGISYRETTIRTSISYKL